jgi:2'-5' RNA ligase
MKILLKTLLHCRRFLFIVNILFFRFLSNRISENNTVIDDDDKNDIPPPRYLTLTDGTYKPNYFISIPITDPALITHYNTYREHLLSSYPTHLTSRANSSDSSPLHLTLLTLHIDGSSQLEQCKIALKRLQEEIRYHCSYPDPMCLEFSGIDTFHDKVLFIKCKSNARLENLRQLIVERFGEQQQKQKLNDIYFAGNYFQFIPHITLLKCKRKFSPTCQNDEFFGKQTIDYLELCSIGKNDQDEKQTNCVFKLDLS